jgi:hypothetical protein
MLTKYWLKSLKARNHLEDFGHRYGNNNIDVSELWW